MLLITYNVFSSRWANAAGSLVKTAGNLNRLKLSESANFSGITIKFKPPNQVLRSNADKHVRREGNLHIARIRFSATRQWLPCTQRFFLWPSVRLAVGQKKNLCLETVVFHVEHARRCMIHFRNIYFRTAWRGSTTCLGSKISMPRFSPQKNLPSRSPSRTPLKLYNTCLSDLCIICDLSLKKETETVYFNVKSCPYLSQVIRHVPDSTKGSRRYLPSI